MDDAKSSILSENSMFSSHHTAGFIPLQDVAQVLNRRQVRFVLVGANAVALYTGAPRATIDVDVLVRDADAEPATQALAEAFSLTPEREKDVIRLQKDGQTRIDLVLTQTDALYQELTASDRYTQTLVVGAEPIRVPTIEMMLALKYSAIVGPWRETHKKHFDIGDFISIVKTAGDLDLAVVEALADIIYPGASREIREKIESVKAGTEGEIKW